MDNRHERGLLLTTKARLPQCVPDSYAVVKGLQINSKSYLAWIFGHPSNRIHHYTQSSMGIKVTTENNSHSSHQIMPQPFRPKVFVMTFPKDSTYSSRRGSIVSNSQTTVGIKMSDIVGAAASSYTFQSVNDICQDMWLPIAVRGVNASLPSL